MYIWYSKIIISIKMVQNYRNQNSIRSKQTKTPVNSLNSVFCIYLFIQDNQVLINIKKKKLFYKSAFFWKIIYDFLRNCSHTFSFQSKSWRKAGDISWVFSMSLFFKSTFLTFKVSLKVIWNSWGSVEKSGSWKHKFLLLKIC